MARNKPQIPTWFIAIVVVITAAVTFWAMLDRNPDGQWFAQPSRVPNQLTQVLSPAMAATNPQRFHQVAGKKPIPRIKVGIPAAHPHRGACTFCHEVVDTVGRAIPSIPALAGLPHQYRGNRGQRTETVMEPRDMHGVQEVRPGMPV